MILQNGERTTTYMLHGNKLTISTTGSKPVTRETSSLTKNKPQNLDEKGEKKNRDIGKNEIMYPF